MGTVNIRLERMLDKIVSSPILVRKLQDKGTIRIKDDEGQTVEIGYEKTDAGYINFSHVDETIRLKFKHEAPPELTAEDLTLHPRAQAILDGLH